VKIEIGMSREKAAGRPPFLLPSRAGPDFGLGALWLEFNGNKIIMLNIDEGVGLGVKMGRFSFPRGTW